MTRKWGGGGSGGGGGVAGGEGRMTEKDFHMGRGSGDAFLSQSS